MAKRLKGTSQSSINNAFSLSLSLFPPLSLLLSHSYRNPISRLMNSRSISTLTRQLAHSHRRLNALVASFFSATPHSLKRAERNLTRIFNWIQEISCLKFSNARREGFIHQIEYHKLSSDCIIIYFLNLVTLNMLQFIRKLSIKRQYSTLFFFTELLDIL